MVDQELIMILSNDKADIGYAEKSVSSLLYLTKQKISDSYTRLFLSDLSNIDFLLSLPVNA